MAQLHLVRMLRMWMSRIRKKSVSSYKGTSPFAAYEFSSMSRFQLGTVVYLEI